MTCKEITFDIEPPNLPEKITQFISFVNSQFVKLGSIRFEYKNQHKKWIFSVFFKKIMTTLEAFKFNVFKKVFSRFPVYGSAV